MTLPTNTARNDYTGSGITGPYPVTFKFFEDSDLLVTVANTDGIETVKTLTTDYTVSGAGEQSGGSITFTSAVTSGYTISIEPKADLTQDTDIKNEGGNLRESIEDRFDRLCRDDQVQQNQLDRALKIQTTDASAVGVTLPPREAGALIGWNDSGTGFANRSASLFASDAAITATGSTTARWMSDRAADVVNVKDFGAVGDGVTDDTAAINAAIATGKVVRIPADFVALFTPPLLVDVDGVSIVGDNRYTSVLKPTATAQPAIVIGRNRDTFGVHIENLKLLGNATCTDGIVLGTISPQQAAVSCSFDHLYIEGFTATDAAAIKPSISWWINVSSCTITGNYHGLMIPTGASVTTLNVGGNTAITQCTKNGFYAPDPTSFLDVSTFRNVSFEYCGQQAIRMSVNKSMLVLDGCYFEQNNSSLPACGQVEFTGGSGLNDYGILVMNDCRTDTPLNSGWMLDLNYSRADIRNCLGLMLGTATPIRTTASTALDIYNATSRSSGDILSLARSMLGSVRVYDKDPATGKYREYNSVGSIFEGHVGAAQPTAPTAAAGSQAGTGGSYTLASGATDTHGQVNFTPGTGTGAGPYVRVTFNKAYASAPIVVCTYASSDGSSAPSIYTTATSSYFDIGFNNTPVAGLKYLSYLVMGN
jgi:hypothetical protein